MKLWQKQTNIDVSIEKFTIGKDKEYDLRIAKYDVLASKVHAKMLCKIGLISEHELESLLFGLEGINERIANYDYVIEDGVEDIHSQIELDLTKRVGEVGKKIHAGRSRNDQVLVALTLYYRDFISTIKKKSKICIERLLSQANNHKAKLMPGYTHSQIGMVSSFGMWFCAYAESLVQDVNYLDSIQKLIDQNPLGSGAGYGSSFPLDREFTTKELGFSSTAINPIFAQMTRGKSELLIGQGLSALAYTLNKFSADVCLFVSANYGFIKLPDAVTTGSSIMPHKKNPDVFELIRAKCNQISSSPVQIQMLINNLMFGYHRDLQSIKEVVFPILDMTMDVLDILIYCIPQIAVKEELLKDKMYDHLFTVEVVNKQVLKGIPFREAYRNVSRDVEAGTFVPNKEVDHTHLGSIGNLGLTEIKEKLNKS